MSLFTTVFLPELEKELIKKAPEIIDYLVENSALVAGHLIDYINTRIQGANHGEDVHTKSD